MTVVTERNRVEERAANLTALLKPRSIAILGASGKRAASGNEAIANLKNRGFAGKLIAVHRDATSIDGIETVSSIAALPRDLDTALVSLPASAVVPALEELAEQGCRSAVVPSVGLTREELAQFERIAHASLMRIHGPNSMGLLNYTDAIPLWFYERMLTDEPPGPAALVAQSGSACLFIVRAAPRVKFSKVISSGNELGITMGDYLSWLADDPSTSCVGVVIESLRDLPGFVAAVGKLRAAGKPVVALRVGGSERGLAATVAHTGALVGAREAYRALFDDLDLPTVADYDEMASVLECFTSTRSRSAPGARVAMVTISGGQAAMGADLAQAKQVQLAELSPETIEEIRATVPDAVAGNPFDIGASLVAGRDEYASCLRALDRDPGVDSVVAVLDAAHTLSDIELSYPQEYFEAVGDAGRLASKPLVVASSSSLTIHELCRPWVGDAPVLRGLGNALVAMRAVAANAAPLEERSDGDPARLEHEDLRRDVAAHSGVLPYDLTRRLLDAYGIATAASALAVDAESAAAVADQIGYPVVAKVASADVAHRTEIGAVKPALATAQAVREAVAEIANNVRRAHPDARIDGFEIQAHIGTSLEGMLGFVSDPVFGATVTVGTGGALIELYPDVAVAAAPLTPSRAARTVAQTKLARMAAGYRNLNPVTDLTNFEKLIVAFSRLAADFADLLIEADLNPVLIEHATGRCRVVDALFVAGSAPIADPQDESAHR
jgi:acyl-CoA synthetase (NDP forming)